MTATEALRRSLNLPAVGLLERYGAARFAAALAPAGLKLPRDAEGSLPVILGGGGMRLRGLVALYAALATDGRFVPLRLARDEAPASSPLLTPAAAAMVATILTRPFPGGGTRTASPGRPAPAPPAGMPGALGFDRAHVVGVWVGRPDATSQPGVAAADLALPPLARAVRPVAAGTPRPTARTPPDHAGREPGR